jgi:cytoskeletal protein RodZ
MRLQTSRFGGASGVRPPFAGLAAVALVLAGVYWWMNLRPRTASMPGDRPAVSRTAAPGAVSSVADGAPPAVVDSGDGASDRTGDAGSGAPTAATAIQGPRMAATVAAHLPGAVASGEGDTVAGMGPARLRLSFSADAWVDVHDAAGRRLYAGNGRANSVKIIAGIAPMKVYIGFASGVQLQVNNRVVAIGPQFVAGDVARFEAGADGVLRRDARPATASNPHPRG